jgi:hypothetical protein
MFVLFLDTLYYPRGPSRSWIYLYLDVCAIFRHVILPSGTLQILDVREEDAGEYRCTATQGELHKLPDQVEKLPWKGSSAASLRVIPGRSRSNLTLSGKVKVRSCTLLIRSRIILRILSKKQVPSQRN